MVKVKICGITSREDAEAACRFGADALGFVFADSPRKVSVVQARAIIKALPPFVSAVGVFVDEDIARVLRIAEYCRLNAIQLHGAESNGYCKEAGKYYKIIKAVHVGGEPGLERINAYRADAFLLDTCVKGRSGGTGKVFDWRLAVRAKKSGFPLILSGGLNANNVSDAIKKVRPFAVDASSGLESSPGVKDRSLMKRFIETAKSINQRKDL